MGIFKAGADALRGTLSDQWKDIITADRFSEHTVVAPGILDSTNNGRGSNTRGSDGVITNGSKIRIPENTAAFIFSQGGIENVITTPGEYEYKNGEVSIFNGDGARKSILEQVKSRVEYGGVASTKKEIAFVNLREIRDIKFGTKGPQVYHDIFYDCDLEVYAYGSFTIKIVDAESFVKNFVPPNVRYYSFDDKQVRAKVLPDLVQSFIVALNALSSTYRISQLLAHMNELSQQIAKDELNAGSWKRRFGFDIVQVSVENIEFSPESRELVNKYNLNKMELKAYENIPRNASNISAQQKIATGIQNNGLGDMGGMLYGVNIAQGISPNGEMKGNNQALTLDEQIDALKKLKELNASGILTDEEFNAKKKEIMGL